MNIKEIKTHFISNLAALARKSKTCERLHDPRVSASLLFIDVDHVTNHSVL